MFDPVVDNNAKSYTPNCYYVESQGPTSFPEIHHQVEKEEYKNSVDFRVNQWVILSEILLVLAGTTLAGAAIFFSAGLATPIVISTAMIAAVVLGGGSVGVLAGSKKMSSALIEEKDVYRVRWLKNDGEVSTKSQINSTESVQAFPTHNGKEAFEWKKRLIESANSRIVLSGNYCGGESFDEVLELFKKGLENKPELKIVLLSSPNFFSQENKRRLSELLDLYSDRFQLIETPDKWMDSEQHMKKITNHTKGLVVDGSHFIMGGSGIEDKYAYYEGVGDRSKEVQGKSSGGMLESLLPRGFRDMDFVFTGNALGKKLDLELLRLARLWEYYNDNDGANNEHRDESVVGKMLSEEVKTEQAKPIKFETHSTHMVKGDCEIICSGPEMKESAFGKRLIEEVGKAKKNIFIDHMYFHPSNELEDLLVKKINEGVKLTIVTNGATSFTPKGHRAFGPRNRFTVASILARVDEDKRKNVEMYEYGQPYENAPRKTTLHKKVMVIDEEVVIAGSGNLGYKSTVTASDHEINFIMRSEEFAAQTIEVIKEDAFKIKRRVIEKTANGPHETDVTLSQKIEDPLRYYTVSNRIRTWFHRGGAWLIG